MRATTIAADHSVAVSGAVAALFATASKHPPRYGLCTIGSLGA
jgi:hypothetical protein